MVRLPVDPHHVEPSGDRGGVGPAELVRRFGDGDLIACATLQEGLERFETSFGMWAFRRVGRVHAALGGPLCAPSDRAEMLERFLRAKRRPLLFYLREPFARLAADAGLHTASIGSDRHLAVPALLASPPRQVTGALKKARKLGFSIEESRFDAVDRARLERIQADYLSGAEVTKEIAFLNRPMSFRADGLRRLFVLKQHERTFGFAVLNAVFDRGRISAWLLDVLRFERTRQWGVWLSSVYSLARGLAQEGCRLAVGFAPLHRLQHPPAASRSLSWQLDLMERRLSSARYLRRLYQLKAGLPGTWEPRSVASFTRAAPRVLHGFMEASGVGFSYLFGPDLLRVIWRGFAGRA